MSEQLLIVGGGYTGARLARLMVATGWRVSILNREPPAVEGCTSIAADLDDTDGLADALRADTSDDRELSVAYLVPPSDLEPDVPGSDPRLQSLLESLTVTAARIVLASTSGVYGDHQGHTVDESTPANPRTRRAKNRVRLEQTLGQHIASNGATGVVLRIAGIYGPGRLPLKAIRESQPIIAPAQSGPGNRIHVDDLAATFAQALSHEDPPAIVNVADGDHVSTSKFTLEVARQAGLAPPPTISLQEAQQQFSPMRLSFLNESRQLDATCLTQRLGVALQYADHRDGIAACLRDEAKL